MRGKRAKLIRRLASVMATVPDGYIDAEVRVGPGAKAKRYSWAWMRRLWKIAKGLPVREVRRIHTPGSPRWWHRALKKVWREEKRLPTGWERLL